MNSVRDRLESILSRLEARARSERVFSKVYAQQARAEADAADARLRDRRALGPLDGRIVSIKDLSTLPESRRLPVRLFAAPLPRRHGMPRLSGVCATRERLSSAKPT